MVVDFGFKMTAGRETVKLTGVGPCAGLREQKVAGSMGDGNAANDNDRRRG